MPRVTGDEGASVVGKTQRSVLDELSVGTRWLVRVRWWVPPLLVAATAAASLAELRHDGGAVVRAAVFILGYNTLFWWVRARARLHRAAGIGFARRFISAQVFFDYGTLLYLVRATGGLASPLLTLFIFHVVFAAVLLGALHARTFAAVAAAGGVVMAVLEHAQAIGHHDLLVRETTMAPAAGPTATALRLGFFLLTLLLAAVLTPQVLQRVRRHVRDLAETSGAIAAEYDKLGALYAMLDAIGARRSLQEVLGVAIRELATIMGADAISVKLLCDDGKLLRFVSALGLPEEVTRQEVSVERSPVSRRIIMGEPFVAGDIGDTQAFQFGEALRAAGLRSALFIPLREDERVQGILGAYCGRANRYGEADVAFLMLAGRLVAIAIENARAYEAVEKMARERSRFMLQVAHNLRAPLAAVIGLLDVARKGLHGPLNDRQQECLDRAERRAQSLATLVNELLSLAESRQGCRHIRHESVDLAHLAGRLVGTFGDSARERGVELRIDVEEGLPKVAGDRSLLEQMLDNLVSNATKYTEQGRVVISLRGESDRHVRIEVTDTGIGIPASALPGVFTDFFRAPNARAMRAEGTGLGLVLARESALLHGGELTLESREGIGTTVTVRLPIDRPAAGAEVGKEAAEDTGDRMAPVDNPFRNGTST